MKKLLGVILGFSLLFSCLGVSASELEVRNGCYFDGQEVKSVSGIEPGTTLDCWVSVKNRSYLFIRDVRVKVTIPDGTRYVSGTGVPTLEKRDGKREIVWTVPHMAPEEERVFFYKLRVLR